MSTDPSRLEIRRLLHENPNAATCLGVYLAAVMAAARCHPRGWLVDEHSQTMSFKDLAVWMLLDQGQIEAAWPLLERAGLILWDESGPHVESTPARHLTEQQLVELCERDRLLVQLVGKRYGELSPNTRRKISRTIEATNEELFMVELRKAVKATEPTQRFLAYICAQTLLAVSGQAMADRRREEQEG